MIAYQNKTEYLCACGYFYHKSRNSKITVIVVITCTRLSKLQMAEKLVPLVNH